MRRLPSVVPNARLRRLSTVCTEASSNVPEKASPVFVTKRHKAIRVETAPNHLSAIAVYRHWQRMDAETLRDSLLFAGGNLDLRAGDDNNKRCSVYGFVSRRKLDPMLA